MILRFQDSKIPCFTAYRSLYTACSQQSYAISILHIVHSCFKTILNNIVDTEVGVTILFNTIYEQFVLQNIVQACFQQHSNKLFIFRVV